LNRLILADVDGVILRHGTEEPSPRVIEAAGYALSEGNMIVPVSSRTAKLMGTVAARLGLRHAGVLDGGATMFDFARNERDAGLSRWLGPEDTDMVVGLIGPHCQEIYYGEDSLAYKAGALIIESSPSVFAVYPNTASDAISNVLSSIDGISSHANRYENSTTSSCVQIVRQGVGKGSGIRWLLADPRYSGIDPHDIMIIGDGEPDIDSFKAAPEEAWRVAMGNADAGLRLIADHIAPHVDDDGFAVALEEFVLR
jgi:HAD superfamily hydrolase (TIGR01484 family)